MATIDIKGIKALGKPEALSPEEYPLEAADGRRRYGDELHDIFESLDDEDFVKVIKGDGSVMMDKAASVLVDGLRFYTDLVLPKMRRSPEELGFLLYITEHIAEKLREVTADENRVKDYAKLLDAFARIAVKDWSRKEVIERERDKKDL